MRRTLTLSTAALSCAVVLAAGAATVVPSYAGGDAVSDIVTGDDAPSATLDGRPAPRAGGPPRSCSNWCNVTLGRTNPNNAAGASCGPTIQVIVQESATAPITYTAPTAGVITSYSHNARAGFTGNLKLLAFSPQRGGAFAQVGKSAFNLVAAGVLNTFPTRVPVPAGAVLGLQSDNADLLCADNGGGLGQIRSNSLANYNPDAPPGDFTGNAADYFINLSAVLEPDSDGDGFGDVSQDGCPQSKLSQAWCPRPDTTVTKAPNRNSTKRKATMVFSSSIAGSTFTCAVDGKAAVPCTSPYKKKFKYGRHIVVITATSPAGIVDPTPVTVTFKVKRPTS